MERSPAGDEDLQKIQACLDGDESAFEFLFNKYRQKVFNLAHRYVGDTEDALDITQECFVKAHHSLRTFEGRSSFYTWLCRLVINACVDFRRAHKAPQPLSLSESPAEGEVKHDPEDLRVIGPSGALELKELESRIQDAIESLPGPQRAVFVLHVAEQMPYKRIADVLDCSVGTVMSRLHYARKKLQESLKPYLEAKVS
ncbi:MAG: sigma-70 family RNA polymerase sigma factor [Planctomycetes bacterium]|nr:sigma-70 family RNA polymerase sigma factor [Planctomycetota bacterium]MBM4082575.1 sigma-70 family RNA polymerase sigma factor [Planctomycetota bacterium]